MPEMGADISDAQPPIRITLTAGWGADRKLRAMDVAEPRPLARVVVRSGRRIKVEREYQVRIGRIEILLVRNGLPVAPQRIGGTAEIEIGIAEIGQRPGEGRLQRQRSGIGLNRFTDPARPPAPVPDCCGTPPCSAPGRGPRGRR